MCVFAARSFFPHRYQVEGMMEKCRELLLETVEVTEENVVSLIDLVANVNYNDLEALKDKVQKFIFTKWEELADSGTLKVILNPENEQVFEIAVGSVSKYRVTN